MKTGTRISYRLRLHGIPLRWESEITAWEPPHRFVDEQRTGPYRVWIHEHQFLEHETGTTVRDTVRYSLAGGELLHRLFVAPDLNKIFELRRQKVAEMFSPDIMSRRLVQVGVDSVVAGSRETNRSAHWGASFEPSQVNLRPLRARRAIAKTSEPA